MSLFRPPRPLLLIDEHKRRPEKASKKQARHSKSRLEYSTERLNALARPRRFRKQSGDDKVSPFGVKKGAMLAKPSKRIKMLAQPKESCLFKK